MIGHPTKTGLSVVFFMLGCVLFSNPLLALFNYKVLVLGVPLLFLYIFAVWLLIILCVVVITKIRPQSVRSHTLQEFDKLESPP
jgi:L-asparagine transporter-like permease